MPIIKIVGESEASLSINANDKTQTVQDIAIKSPKLWSPDSAYLYKAEVTLFVNGNAEDMTTSSFWYTDNSVSVPKMGLCSMGKK